VAGRTRTACPRGHAGTYRCWAGDRLGGQGGIPGGSAWVRPRTSAPSAGC